jgi:hypothetical protein
MKAKLLEVGPNTTKAEIDWIIAKLLEMSTDDLIALLNDSELKDSFKQVVVYLKQVESEPERGEKIYFLLPGDLYSPLWVELSEMDDNDIMTAIIPIMIDLLASDEESAKIAHINLRARGDITGFYPNEEKAYVQLLLDYEKEH